MRRAEQTAAAKHVSADRDPDHRAVGSATPDTRLPDLLSAEGMETWTVREVWISDTAAPTHYADVPA